MRRLRRRYKQHEELCTLYLELCTLCFVLTSRLELREDKTKYKVLSTKNKEQSSKYKALGFQYLCATPLTHRTVSLAINNSSSVGIT